jgi:hypothetical protein
VVKSWEKGFLPQSALRTTAEDAEKTLFTTKIFQIADFRFRVSFAIEFQKTWTVRVAARA